MHRVASDPRADGSLDFPFVLRACNFSTCARPERDDVLGRNTSHLYVMGRDAFRDRARLFDDDEYIAAVLSRSRGGLDSSTAISHARRCRSCFSPIRVRFSLPIGQASASDAHCIPIACQSSSARLYAARRDLSVTWKSRDGRSRRLDLNLLF